MAVWRTLLPLIALGCGAAPNGAPAPQPVASASPSAEGPANHTYVGGTVQIGAGVTIGQARGNELEETAVAAFRRCLGQAEGGSPLAASAAIVALRASPVQVKLVPFQNGGRFMDPLLVTLQDSFTDRVTMLQRKALEQTATPAETAELQEGAKYVFKVTDLRTAVGDVSRATMLANTTAHELARRNAEDSKVVGRRAASAQDVARDRESIAKQKQAYVILAATAGMLAALEAVINQGKDPRALDVIAQGALASFPVHVVVTDAEKLGDPARNDAPNPADAFAKHDLKATFDVAIPLVQKQPLLRDALVTARKLLLAK
jgi:hypothetical protein